VPVGADDIEAAQVSDPVSFPLLPAAEPDIRPPAGHVRRDGDGAQPARLGDDPGLELIVPGVEDLQGNARSPQSAASSSDSLTLSVPTRMGRPEAWTSAISRTRARVLAFLFVKTTSDGRPGCRDGGPE